MRVIVLSGLLVTACATSSGISAPAPETPYVCTYSLNPTYLEPAVLRLTPGGAPFAKTTSSAAAGVEYRLPYGPSAQGAHLTFTSGWVTMNVNFTPTDGFELAVLSSHQLSPVLTLPRGARATWVGSMGGHLVVETRRPDDFENQLPVRFTLPCNQTSIASIAMAADDALYSPDAGARRHVAIDPGVRLPVSATPGGPASEVLTRADLLVVIGETPEALHVHEWFSGLVLDGWVPRALVHDTPASMSAILGMLGSRGTSVDKHQPRCAANVPLLLRHEGRLTPLGTVRQGAAWKELRREGAWVDVAFPELTWLTLEPGAAFVISSDSATACAQRPDAG